MTLGGRQSPSPISMLSFSKANEATLKKSVYLHGGCDVIA